MPDMRPFAATSLPATALIALGSLASTAHAQNLQILAPGLSGCDWTTGKIKAMCIPIFIGHLVQLVFSVISVFFLLNVLYAGYQIAMGSWTGEKAAGKDRLTWSIIGLAVSVCTYLIMNLVLTVISPT